MVKTSKDELANDVNEDLVMDPSGFYYMSTVGTKHLRYNVFYPSGDEQVYVPMLDFTMEGNIGRGRDDDHVNELDLIRLALGRDREDPHKRVTTFFFMSPPGLGKTVMGSFLARDFKCPYQVINCVATMTDLDLLGSHVLIGQETIWQDGPLPSIIRATNEHGMGILIINELNALTLNAQIGLNPLLDKQQCVTLALNNNEIVRVEHGAQLLVLASMNPDILGVNEIQDSLRDRCNAVVYMDYPSVDREARLVHDLTGIPEDIATRFCEAIHEGRLLKTRDHQLTKAPSTRGLLDWIRYTRAWGAAVAYELAIVNRYGTTSEERNALRMIARGKNVASITLPEEQTEQRSTTTREVREWAWMLHDQGKPVAEIASLVRRSVSTVHRYLKDRPTT